MEKSVTKRESIPIALELATKQREISVAEFFSKNRHLLGFDNKKKALMTTIKEAVDKVIRTATECFFHDTINTFAQFLRKLTPLFFTSLVEYFPENDNSFFSIEILLFQ